MSNKRPQLGEIFQIPLPNNYVRGEIIPSTEDVCKDLERVAVWDRNHIVDRIMGDTKWNPQ